MQPPFITLSHDKDKRFFMYDVKLNATPSTMLSNDKEDERFFTL